MNSRITAMILCVGILLSAAGIAGDEVILDPDHGLPLWVPASAAFDDHCSLDTRFFEESTRDYYRQVYGDPQGSGCDLKPIDDSECRVTLSGVRRSGVHQPSTFDDLVRTGMTHLVDIESVEPGFHAGRPAQLVSGRVVASTDRSVPTEIRFFHLFSRFAVGSARYCSGTVAIAPGQRGLVVNIHPETPPGVPFDSEESFIRFDVSVPVAAVRYQESLPSGVSTAEELFDFARKVAEGRRRSPKR